MEAKPSWTTAGETQLDEFADLARQVILFTDTLSQPSIDALELAGWHSGKTFGLRAELAHVVECADRVRRGRAVGGARRRTA